MTDLISNRLDIKGATERIEPERSPQGILSIHLKRYQFALDYCKGKSVLDAACGVGYGSAELAQVAASVIGIDIDSEAISYGQKRYGCHNLTLQVADVTKTGFADAQFEVICSFETIEHLPDIPAYLREMTRILEPGGTYIVSTPQVPKTDHNPTNPYHTIEFSRIDFEVLLNKYFEDIEIYGQRRKQSELHYRITQFLDFTGLRSLLPKLGKLRESVNQTLKTTTFEEMSLEDILITKDKIERATEVIAVCRKPRKVARG
ncbi:MAG: class I SAM-dependent methyltransferase [Xenococcaceae cyanobacterium]